MKSITPKETFALCQSGKAILIDVREQEEFDTCHVDGAQLFPLSVLPLKADTLSLPSDKTVIIMCRSGGRSAQAIDYLQTQVCKECELYNMTGGIMAWMDCGLPTAQ